MTINAKGIYCFIEKYEGQITNALGAGFALWLIRVYFNNTDPEFGQLTKEEETKLKASQREINRILRSSKVKSKSKSKSKLLKLRGGMTGPIEPNAKLLTEKIARLCVNGLINGSVNTASILIACKVSPRAEKFVKTICLGGKTEALVNELALNLQRKRIAIIKHLVRNPKVLKSLNDLLLELEVITRPLDYWDLTRLAAYGISICEVPIVKGAFMVCQGFSFMVITNTIRTSIKRAIYSEIGQEVGKIILITFTNALTGTHAESVCGVDMKTIEEFKQAMLSRPRGLPSGYNQVLAPNNVLKFNDEIIDFVEGEPIIEKLTGSQLLNDALIPYSPKFNVDYVIKRLVIGNDINTLPRDHITNLW